MFGFSADIIFMAAFSAVCLTAIVITALAARS